MTEIVTILVPPGYSSAEDFARDCGVEIVSTTTPTTQGLKPVYLKRWRTIVFAPEAIAAELTYAIPGEPPHR